MLTVISSYKSTPGGNGTLSHHACRLREAIVRYPLRLQNDTVTLAPMPLSENRTVELIFRQPETQGQGSASLRCQSEI